jgi:hypothetical protein
VKSPKLPALPPPPPPPVSASGADAAAAADAAVAVQKKKFSFDKTILRPGGLGALPPNTTRTLGS